MTVPKQAYRFEGPGHSSNHPTSRTASLRVVRHLTVLRTRSHTNPKTVSPATHVKEFMGDCLEVRHGKLFCVACREEVSLKRSTVKNHIYSGHKHSVASSPGPSPPRRGLVHTVCTCAKYSVTFSVKSFVHFLVYKTFFEIHSSDDLTYRTLLGYVLFRRGSVIFPNIEK